MLTTSQIRMFGAGGGPKISSNATNTDIGIPSVEDVEVQLGGKFNYNDKFLMWINGYIPFDTMGDKLVNDKVNKYSAYHQFGTNALFQNGLILKALRLLFGENQAPTSVKDPHGQFNGVTTHENAIFLYQSKHASHTLKLGYADFAPIFLAGTWLFAPAGNLALLPFLITTLYMPRRWSTLKHFTWHAELLPHTEQVVLHKTFLFGGVDKHFVDIKNLEKVTREHVDNPLIFFGNMFDDNMIFRDSESEEVFVFDK